MHVGPILFNTVQSQIYIVVREEMFTNLCTLNVYEPSSSLYSSAMLVHRLSSTAKNVVLQVRLATRQASLVANCGRTSALHLIYISSQGRISYTGSPCARSQQRHRVTTPTLQLIIWDRKGSMRSRTRPVLCHCFLLISCLCGALLRSRRDGSWMTERTDVSANTQHQIFALYASVLFTCC